MNKGNFHPNAVRALIGRAKQKQKVLDENTILINSFDNSLVNNDLILTSTPGTATTK